MLNMPELLHNKSAVSIHDGAFQTNKERMPGLTPGVRKIYNPHLASPAGCNFRYLSCVVYTIPYLRILCKFLPNVLGILFFLFLSNYISKHERRQQNLDEIDVELYPVVSG